MANATSRMSTRKASCVFDALRSQSLGLGRGLSVRGFCSRGNLTPCPCLGRCYNNIGGRARTSPQEPIPDAPLLARATKKRQSSTLYHISCATREHDYHLPYRVADLVRVVTSVQLAEALTALAPRSQRYRVSDPGVFTNQKLRSSGLYWRQRDFVHALQIRSDTYCSVALNRSSSLFLARQARRSLVRT